MDDPLSNLDELARGLDKTSPVPYYHQIAQALRGAIEASGSGADARPFPSEARLCAAFGVTRGTIRQALRALERQGLIHREKGRGTFISGQRPRIDVTHLASTAGDMQAAGIVPGFSVLGVEQLPAPVHVARALGIAAEAGVWQVRRIRLADNEPVCLQSCWIAVATAPELDRLPLERTLIELLREHYGIRYDHAERVIRARNATAEEAELLGLPSEEAVFAVSGPSFDADERPIDYVDSVWRGDSYDFTVQLSFAE